VAIFLGGRRFRCNIDAKYNNKTCSKSLDLFAPTSTGRGAGWGT
jgi:hypothetical protein